MTRVVGAVLAAGSGTRMGRAKAEIVVNGTRLLDRAVAALGDGGCVDLVAVVRAGTRVTGARPVINDDPTRGMRSSLELAVQMVEVAHDIDALAVILVDTPGVSAEAIGPVVDAWRPGRIAVGTYAGRRGHPTVMSPAMWREALELAGPDEGARALLTARAAIVDEIAVPGDASDLDTPADLASWRSR